MNVNVQAYYTKVFHIVYGWAQFHLTILIANIQFALYHMNDNRKLE